MMKLDKESNFYVKTFCVKCNTSINISAKDVRCECKIDKNGVKFSFFVCHNCGNRIMIPVNRLSKELQEVLCFQALRRIK